MSAAEGGAENMKGEYTLVGPDLSKINVRKLDIIPFRKYRFDPDPEELEEEYESSWIDVALPVVGGIVLVMLGLFL